MKLKIDYFILLILLMIVLAWFVPHWGTFDGPVSLHAYTTVGTGMIFFLYGLGLSFRDMVKGLLNWPLHVLVQWTTFVLFPLLIVIISLVFSVSGNWFLALFFLAALPSTVSSAVVMVSLAGGNVPAAVFNAGVSSLAGVFITPLLMGLVLVSQHSGFDMSQVISKLIAQVLLPLVAGMLLHRFFGAWAKRNRKFTKYFDQSVILAIIFTSFSASFTSGIFAGMQLPVILLLILGMLTLLGVVLIVTYLLGRNLNFPVSDIITLQFCGSTKSLVHGSVMAKVMFGSTPVSGIILLPILVYHAVQLVVISLMSSRYASHGGKTVQ